jgi:hypothetical protein
MIRAYDFWTKKSVVVGGRPPLASLVFYTEGRFQGSEMAFQFSLNTPIEEQLVVADRVLAGVQQWRDGIAEAAEGERTAADELAQAA